MAFTKRQLLLISSPLEKYRPLCSEGVGFQRHHGIWNVDSAEAIGMFPSLSGADANNICPCARPDSSQPSWRHGFLFHSFWVTEEALVMFFWNFQGIFPTSLHMILWHPVLMLFSLFSSLLIFLSLTLWPHQNLSNSSLFRNFWLRILFNQGADCLHQVSVLSQTLGGQFQVSVQGPRFSVQTENMLRLLWGRQVFL